MFEIKLRIPAYLRYAIGSWMPPKQTRRGGVTVRTGTMPANELELIVIGAMPNDAQVLPELLRALPHSPARVIILVPYGGDAAKRNPFAALRSRRDVVAARSGQRIEPGGVYFLRYDRPLTAKDGRFVAGGAADRKRSAGPLSMLLSSLAEITPRLNVKVVLLAGDGSDYEEGLRAVKKIGGTAIIQDPASAAFDRIPRGAIASGLVDRVVPPAGIARELLAPQSRSKRAGSGEAASDPDMPDADETGQGDAHFRIVLSLLKNRFRIDLTQYKQNTIRRRIERRMHLSRFHDIATYAEYLRSNADGLKALHDDLFIHVTQFFRDPESFDALKARVLPAVLDEAGEGPIRIWVPGCSTGEEAYSIGMSLIECAEQQDKRLTVQIFATDISDAAIQQARRAVYPEPLLRNIGARRLERFFEEVKDGHKIRKELRDLCVFSRHDVASNPPFARLDLVSFRNVLIYFGPELQKKVLPIFHYALKPNGFLWLGHSETQGASSKLFALVDKKHKIYTKVASPPEYLQLATSGCVTERVEVPRNPVREAPSETDFRKSADQLVLFKYGPPGVIIDCDLEILQFRGRTMPFLEPAAGHPTHNVLRMGHGDLLPALRSAIQSAKKHNRPERREDLSLTHDGTRTMFHLEVAPLNPLAPERERQYLVVFERVQAQTGAQSKAAGARARSQRVARNPIAADAARQTIEHLQQELDALRERQQTLIEQFESTQEELRSANEELQAANEEFQSTNEELETAREELQSANEELTTTNDELQTRNTELVALNEKLAHGEDRFRLMVEGVKDYAIYMLDPDGRVTTWNEGARRLKGYEASEIIGQFYSRFFGADDVSARLPEHELERARIEGRFEAEGWRIRKDGSRFWASVVVTRINDGKGQLIGFSKVTRDLTERRRAAEALELSERRFRLMISSVRDYAIFFLDPEGRVASWNEGARELKGYEEAEIIGQHFSVFYPPDERLAGKLERKIETVLAQGRAEDEGWRIRKDGTRFWANVVITRINDASGKLIGFTKVTRDLTDRKRAEQALQRTNETLEQRVRERTNDLERALRVRDEFLSIASHELKTPLTSLKLQLQVAKRKIEAAQGAAVQSTAIQTFEKTLKQATTLEDLVEDLLDISRAQTGHLELELKSVDVADLIEEVASRFTDQLSEARSSLDLRLEPGISARWDSRRVAQVFMNLISNAIKYAPGSPITISAARRDRGVRIVVEDAGPGISPEKQGAIFERFERAGASASVGGLGLGLFIARKIVEAHGGVIGVESALGQGARFIVDLPMMPKHLDQSAAREFA